MALKSSSQTLGEAFAGVGQAKKIAFDIETLQSAADIINTRLEQSQADYTKKKQKRTTGGFLGSMLGTALGVGIGLATGGIGTIGLMGAGAAGSWAGGEVGRSAAMGFDTGDIEMTEEYMELIKNKDPELAKRLEGMALKGTLEEQIDTYKTEQERTKEAEKSLGTWLTGGRGGSKAGSYGTGLLSGHGNARYDVYGDILSGAFSGLTAGVGAGGKSGIAEKHLSGELAKGGAKGVEGWKSLRKMQGKDVMKNIGWMYTGGSKAKTSTVGADGKKIDLSQLDFSDGNEGFWAGLSDATRSSNITGKIDANKVSQAQINKAMSSATNRLNNPTSSSRLGDWFSRVSNAPAYSSPFYQTLNKQMQNYLDYRYQNQSAQNAYDVPNYMPTTNLYG